MSDEVPNLRGGHFDTFKWLAGIILGAAGLFGSLIWQAAKYADRSEFNSLVSRVESTAQSAALTEDRVQRVQLDIAEIKTDLRSLREQKDSRRSRGQ